MKSIGNFLRKARPYLIGGFITLIVVVPIFVFAVNHPKDSENAAISKVATSSYNLDEHVGVKTRVNASGLDKTNFLANLQVGSCGWTVPWGMIVTPQHNGFLDGTYDFFAERGGTVQMEVCRTEKGFVVSVPKGYHYEAQTAVSEKQARSLVPVYEINTGKNSY